MDQPLAKGGKGGKGKGISNSRPRPFEGERQGAISVKQRVRSGDDSTWRGRKPPLPNSLIPLLPSPHRML
ncbi:MAG: hypothetical protein BGO99_00535 [Nitrosospira sp. 56-18]|nr:hypothetical protein [Nitrosospira sp.]OJY07782.1 MAG: hypothetical protein BGO99_00535 [Nitrosospira sp. 56-18]